MSINHKDISNPERHLPRDFEGAANETVLGKDENGNLEWLDRNQVGGPPGPPGTTDHDQLVNLENDTHPQYLRTDGNRSMTGNLDLGGNSVENVDEINGIPAIVASSTNAGFMSSSDKDKLDNIPANTQAQINQNANDISLNTGNINQNTSDIATNQAAFETHSTRHAPSGADPLPVDSPVDIGSTNSEGSANSFSRSDHQHSHGNQAGGGLHQDVTPSTSGFMSATDKSKLDGIPANTQAQITQNASDISQNLNLINGHASRHLPAGADPIATAAPTSTLGGNTTNQEGTDNSLSRSDHSHNIATGVPNDIGDTNLEGSANSLARSDHEHNVFPVFNEQDIEDASFQSTTGTGFTNALNLSTPNLPTGRYKIKWFYVWSYNSTGADFVARVQLGNSDDLLPVHLAEPQDSGGAGNGGTNQRFPASGWAYRNLSGVQSIDVDFASSSAGILAGVHLVRLSIKRVG